MGPSLISCKNSAVQLALLGCYCCIPLDIFALYHKTLHSDCKDMQTVTLARWVQKCVCV